MEKGGSYGFLNWWSSACRCFIVVLFRWGCGTGTPKDHYRDCCHHFGHKVCGLAVQKRTIGVADDDRNDWRSGVRGSAYFCGLRAYRTVSAVNVKEEWRKENFHLYSSFIYVMHFLFLILACLQSLQ